MAADEGFATPAAEAPELVEVWVQPELLRALRGSVPVPCLGVGLRQFEDGTTELGLQANRSMVRTFYRWPVSGPDAHLLEVPFHDDPIEVDA